MSNSLSIQSAATLQYADRISAEGITPSATFIMDMTVNHMMVRLQSWSFWESYVTVHCHYFQGNSDPDWYYLLEFHLWFK